MEKCRRNKIELWINTLCKIAFLVFDYFYVVGETRANMRIASDIEKSAYHNE